MRLSKRRGYINISFGDLINNLRPLFEIKGRIEDGEDPWEERFVASGLAASLIADIRTVVVEDERVLHLEVEVYSNMVPELQAGRGGDRSRLMYLSP